MNHNRIDNALHTLMSLNWEIKKKEGEVKTAIEYNKAQFLYFKELSFDIPKLNEEIQELELEFNRTKRELWA